MMRGVDYLGGANYGRVILNNHPDGWAAGFMLNTNRPHWKRTDCWGIIEGLCKRGVPLVRVHAVWEDDHTYKPRSHDAIIDREFRRAVDVQRKYPGTKIQFSWICENNMTAAQNSAMVKKYGGQGVELVNSVWKGHRVPGCVTEVHGGHGAVNGVYSYSYDGDHCVDSDVKRLEERHKRASVFFYWVVQCNGRYNNKPRGSHGWDSTPRDKREAWLYKKLLESVIFLASERGDVSLRNGQLWKSHADQHGKPDARANKPVLLTSALGKEAELVAGNGRVIAKGAHGGVFNDGSRRNIYRFGKWGYELARQAMNVAGSPIVRIRIGGKFVGRVNPGFRAGVFRD